MHTIWKGAINFGLINVPVKLSAATGKEDISFRLLHKDCKQPLNQKRWCARCNKEVAYEDTVRGYEYEKGRFVVMDDEDIKKVNVKSTRYISIMDFIEIADVDPIYYEKTYYLQPETAGEKPYLILRDAMRDTGRAAVAKITIREKEHLCVIRVTGNALCLETMYFADEIRDASGLGIEKIEKKVEVSAAERDMAAQLVNNLAGKFEPEKYHDAYREELLKLIEAKIEGGEIEERAPVEVDQSKVIDLMERLRASVEATKKKAQ